ncbi:MAG TPA: hypothetical protein VJ598_06845 [Albitalea sp.]|nr:hypothetical protein [Albitalea sp.]
MQQIRTWALAGSLVAAFGLAHAGAVKTEEGTEYKPTGKGQPEIDNLPGAKGRNQAAGAATGKNGMVYHGGPVMTSTAGTNIYYIWYGNWSGNTATTILTNFASNIAPSPYFNINTSYYDAANKKVTNAAHYLGATTDSYSKGTALSDGNIQTIVSDAITSGRLPKDTNAVYFVLTSADVNATSGFCTQYCGWHTHGSIGGSDIKYSFVGNPDRCPSSCADQTVGPSSSGPRTSTTSGTATGRATRRRPSSPI